MTVLREIVEEVKEDDLEIQLVSLLFHGANNKLIKRATKYTSHAHALKGSESKHWGS